MTGENKITKTKARQGTEEKSSVAAPFYLLENRAKKATQAHRKLAGCSLFFCKITKFMHAILTVLTT
jgi:hypothetical protein